MSARILLVGCSKTKLAGRHPARELYRGDLFKAARRYAEARGDRWMIFSGLHGLVEPDAVVESYDRAIPGVSEASARRALLDRLIEQVRTLLGAGPLVFEVHAGAPYVEALRYVRALHPRGSAPPFGIETPLAGLGLGQRKRWYAR